MQSIATLDTCKILTSTSGVVISPDLHAFIWSVVQEQEGYRILFYLDLVDILSLGGTCSREHTLSLRWSYRHWSRSIFKCMIGVAKISSLSL